MPSTPISDPPVLTTRLNELALPKQTKLIDRVFVRLNSIYGPLWSSHYATEALLAAAKAEWRLTLGARTLGQIKLAFTACLTAHPDYPPTLGQFDALCRQRSGPWLGASMPAHYHRPALPGPQTLTRAEAMQRMRATLGLDDPLGADRDELV